MKRMLTASAVLLLLVFSLQAHATGPLGRDTIGTIPSGGLRADFQRGSKFTLSEPAIVTHICAYVDTRGGATGRQGIRFALYRDAHGVPGTKVTETQESSFPSGGPAAWECLAAGYLPVAPGAYWIMIHTGGTAGIVRYYYDGPANWYGAADAFEDGSSASFGTGGTGDGTLSIQALYMPQTEWKIAGSATVGSTPSGPMRADFKRASSVVLPRRATLFAISVYLDALGGGTGNQSFDLELYGDQNGKPGARLISVNFGGQGRAGYKGRWFTAEAASPLLEPGRYWISVLTSQPTGVLRYFMQGTGNWYGNVNLWFDGPADPFGPATPGDGTISAFLVYGPPFEPLPPPDD